MEFGTGTGQEDFKKFLMEDYHQPKQKQSKLSKVSKNPYQKTKVQPEMAQSDGQDPSYPGSFQPNQANLKLGSRDSSSRQGKQKRLKPIPEEGQRTPNYYQNDSGFSNNSRAKSDSNTSNPQYVPPSFKGPQYSSSTSDNYPPASMTTGGGAGGNYADRSASHKHFRMLKEQTDEDLIIFARKMFSFISLQKILMSIFIIIVYNNVPFTEYIGSNFYIFAISGFVLMTILMLVHVALDLVRKSPVSQICYFLFLISESWVLAFLLASTESSTVFLFAVSLTGNVLAISIFLNTYVINWFRGLISLLVMTLAMFVISILTLNFADLLTISVCLMGAFLFGVFYLSKAFSLLQNKYSHPLQIEDYIIGSLTLYADFGFVLLCMLFIMMTMIKSFTS